MKKQFAIIGVAGYIAPKHLQAIYDVDGELIAACDCNDSVGVLDKYFPETTFFLNETEFFAFIKNKVDFVVVCTPNYLHEQHIIESFKIGADVICEKPLTTKIHRINTIKEAESKYNHRVFTILQLRLDETLQNIQQEIANSNDYYTVDLNYFTPRGDWYQKSWKGDIEKSGGILYNIGIHFFDLLFWFFGELKQHQIEKITTTEAIGVFEFERATINWHLSIDKHKSATRSLTINNADYLFTNEFHQLHTKSYKAILSNNGFGIDTVKKSIAIIEAIQNQ
ncbi:MAG: Gfo/Idh/MocA family oxidoreductase [Chitinophagales bacterium]|nr:Gfo/Idh/MocA family oxidoreductase [Chitinophagales bacterium]